MKPAIEIRNLGKEYKLTASQPYMSLRDTIAGSVKKILQPGKKNIEKFWALKDINLNIQPGERVGIIGRNGAGKSTLLKIISRITPPTTGHVTINGRVGSLLEVGTGFHPELTGRENIYLNGSILGLKKAEINKQLDAIIDFSGVEKFIDTPLKHFSSGMQLRLAFSVAAHLEPEILLIDEVLAVGDIEFQKKCITKMEEVSHNNSRTIVFISHNLSHLKQLCTTAVLLNKGQLIISGTISEVITAYSHLINSEKKYQWETNNLQKDYLIEEIKLENSNGQIANIIDIEEPLFISISIKARKKIDNSIIAIRLTNQDRIPVLTTTNADFEMSRQLIDVGRSVFKIPLPADILVPGLYSLDVAWIIPHIEVLDNATDCILFEISNRKDPGLVLQDGRLGVINKIINWIKC